MINIIKKQNKEKSKGFTLLIAIITTSLLLVVSFMVVNLALKQLVISNTTQESQYSFYNADTGIECATFWDIKNINGTNPFNPSTAGSITCNGSSITPTSVYSGRISTSTYTMNLIKGCTSVDVVRNQATGMTTVISRGYDNGGANCTGGSTRRFERGVTSTFPSNPQIPVNVTWKNPFSVDSSVANVLKSTSSTGAWDSGASSNQSILYGDGYIEFSTNENNLRKMGALSNGDPDANYTGLDYAIHMAANGDLNIFENNNIPYGRSAPPIGSGPGNNDSNMTYSAGDVFKIAVVNGQVKYYKNGILLYTSLISPTYPLILDTTFGGQNGTITNAKVAS